MKLSYSSMKTGGYLLAFFLLFGIVVTVASSTAQAQYRDRSDRYGNDRYRNDRYRDRDWNRNNGFQVARQQGYSYGMNVGAADAQRGQSFNPQRSRYYRDGTLGYNSYYGNRGQYRQVFRDAFNQGYRDGFQRYAYRRNDRWPRRW
jgi:hypothetical protein